MNIFPPEDKMWFQTQEKHFTASCRGESAVLLLTCFSLNVPFKICSRVVFGLAAKSVYSFINLLFPYLLLFLVLIQNRGLFFGMNWIMIQELVSTCSFNQGSTMNLILRSRNKRASLISTIRKKDSG